MGGGICEVYARPLGLAREGAGFGQSEPAGGPTALWSGGYKVGPGRALPFGIVLVRR